MKVSELMTKDPISCRPSDTVRRVAQMMRDHGLVLIPVINEAERLVGVITDRDLCCRFIVVGSDPEQETIQPYMSIDPVTCHVDDEIGGCEQLMRKNGIHRIPVVDEDARCVGIVCPTDFVGEARGAGVKRAYSCVAYNNGEARFVMDRVPHRTVGRARGE